jgi:hypothetical protein
MITGCSSEQPDNARFIGPCADPTVAIVPAAVDAFVGSINPKPRRFLIPSGPIPRSPRAPRRGYSAMGRRTSTQATPRCGDACWPVWIP